MDAAFDRVLEAIEWATVLHKGQKRGRGKQAVPYVTHCIAVCRLVHQVTGYAPALIAAVLHDVLEDTEATSDEVEDRFGTEVLYYVEALTLPEHAKCSIEVKTQYQVNTMVECSDYVRYIKIADKTHNLTSLQTEPPGWGVDREMRYIKSAEMVVDTAMRYVSQKTPELAALAEQFQDVAAQARHGRGERVSSAP
jgi:(p)ppGpp synthase/HD superfamily hydrolase